VALAIAGQHHGGNLNDPEVFDEETMHDTLHVGIRIRVQCQSLRLFGTLTT
jgi:hypothetical protein